MEQPHGCDIVHDICFLSNESKVTKTLVEKCIKLWEKVSKKAPLGGASYCIAVIPRMVGAGGLEPSTSSTSKTRY